MRQIWVLGLAEAAQREALSGTVHGQAGSGLETGHMPTASGRLPFFLQQR